MVYFCVSIHNQIYVPEAQQCNLFVNALAITEEFQSANKVTICCIPNHCRHQQTRTNLYVECSAFPSITTGELRLIVAVIRNDTNNTIRYADVNATHVLGVLDYLGWPHAQVALSQQTQRIQKLSFRSRVSLAAAGILCSTTHEMPKGAWFDVDVFPGTISAIPNVLAASTQLRNQHPVELETFLPICGVLPCGGLLELLALGTEGFIAGGFAAALAQPCPAQAAQRLLPSSDVDFFIPTTPDNATTVPPRLFEWAAKHQYTVAQKGSSVLTFLHATSRCVQCIFCSATSSIDDIVGAFDIDYIKVYMDANHNVHYNNQAIKQWITNCMDAALPMLVRPKRLLKLLAKGVKLGDTAQHFLDLTVPPTRQTMELKRVRWDFPTIDRDWDFERHGLQPMDPTNQQQYRARPLLQSVATTRPQTSMKKGMKNYVVDRTPIAQTFTFCPQRGNIEDYVRHIQHIQTRTRCVRIHTVVPILLQGRLCVFDRKEWRLSLRDQPQGVRDGQANLILAIFRKFGHSPKYQKHINKFRESDTIYNEYCDIKVVTTEHTTFLYNDDRLDADKATEHLIGHNTDVRVIVRPMLMSRTKVHFFADYIIWTSI